MSNADSNADFRGLCADCRNMQVMRSDRGSVFYLCQLWAIDPQYPKYPRLPVLRCAGYEKSNGASTLPLTRDRA